MSVKRQATTELNHDNWDQEDPAEHEEMGTFKTASKDILDKRVIRTAKRRSQIGGEAKKSVFSAFGGFSNKTPPSSFDFLANLTNGGKGTNGSSAEKKDDATLSIFGTKSVSNSGGIFDISTSSAPTFGVSSSSTPAFGVPTSTAPVFGMSTSSTPTFGVSTSSTPTFGVTTSSTPTFGVSTSPTPTFGLQSPQSSNLFTGTKMSTTASPSLFTSTKNDSPATNNLFKPQSSLENKNQNDTSTNDSSNTQRVSMFSGNDGNTKPLFSATNLNSTTFKTQSLSSSSTNQVSSDKSQFANSSKDSVKNLEEKKDDKKVRYYTKLKGLNESVSDWIKKHVEETPLCILSPIFKDYERYLKEIQDEFHGRSDDSKPKQDSNNLVESTTETKSKPTTELVSSQPATNSLKSKGSPFSSQIDTTPISSSPTFGINNSAPTTAGFSFGIKTSTPTTTSSGMPSAGFSFGITTTTQAPTAPPSTGLFSLNTNTTTSNTGSAPFSFGIGKPFSFKSNIQSNTEQNQDKKEEEDEPPKVEFTPIVEDNSVYDKRCKIFEKKDGNFVDKGIGTLYIKHIEETGKHQLLVRANTNLGNILVNLILSSSIPIQRMGKNNVMMVCIPTPDAKPTSILIRVKSSDEADELLETLNKFKE